jgi:MoaA/NifB/PqqE/SkfB family radical SAM enzyme
MRASRLPFLLAIRDGFAHIRSIAALKKEELSQKEWIRIFTTLKEWLGPYRLTISGGEPFLRKDLVEIIRFCHENEIQTVVCTNGTLFTPEIITMLSGLSTLILTVSLDGSTPQTHDYLRGVAGTYQKVISALQQFKSPTRRCLIYIATVLMGYNCDEILDIVKLSHERKLADGVIFQTLDQTFGLPYDKAWFHRNSFWPKGDVRDRLIDVIGQLIDLKGEGVMIYNSIEQLRRFQEYFTDPTGETRGLCASFDSSFFVNHWGEVLFCWKMNSVAHFSEGPAQIWDSTSAQKKREDIRRCQRTCRLLNCNFKQPS